MRFNCLPDRLIGVKHGLQWNQAVSIATSYQNYSPDWWTPPEWLDWVRATFGGEFFDPCPGTWQKGEPDGLDLDWLPPTYCNHPGSRGSAQRWWSKFLEEEQYLGALPFIWCAFSIEQLRHMEPSPFGKEGWLVMPVDRIGFIWGGADRQVGTNKKTGEPIIRKHGERAKSPGNWTVFWTNCKPAIPPQECRIIKTDSTSFEITRKGKPQCERIRKALGVESVEQALEALGEGTESAPVSGAVSKIGEIDD